MSLPFHYRMCTYIFVLLYLWAPLCSEVATVHSMCCVECVHTCVYLTGTVFFTVPTCSALRSLCLHMMHFGTVSIFAHSSLLFLFLCGLCHLYTQMSSFVCPLHLTLPPFPLPLLQTANITPSCMDRSVANVSCNLSYVEDPQVFVANLAEVCARPLQVYCVCVCVCVCVCGGGLPLGCLNLPLQILTFQIP